MTLEYTEAAREYLNRVIETQEKFGYEGDVSPDQYAAAIVSVAHTFNSFNNVAEELATQQ